MLPSIAIFLLILFRVGGGVIYKSKFDYKISIMQMYIHRTVAHNYRITEKIKKNQQQKKKEVNQIHKFLLW